jgi:O-antigen/teichoic acid export membrane protein
MRRVTRNAAALLAGDLTARGLGFFSTVYLARVLGVDAFGLVTLGLSVLSYAIWFSDLGLVPLGTREFARPADQRVYAAGDFLLLRVLLAAVIFVVFSTAILLTAADEAMSLTLPVFLLTVFASALVLEWYYQGIEYSWPVAFNRCLFSGAYLGLVVWTVHGPADVPLVAWSYLAASTAAALGMYFPKRLPDRFFSAGFAHRLPKLLKLAASVGIGSIFGQLVPTLPPIVLGFLVSTTEAGLFGAAAKVTFLILILDRIFGLLFLPAFTRLHTTSDPTLPGKLSVIIKYVTAAGISFATAVCWYAPALVELIFGAAYLDSALTLRIMVWFIPATLMNSFYSFGLLGMGCEKDYVKVMIVGGALSIVAIIVAGVRYGAPGAAAAMVGGEMLITALALRKFTGRLPIKVHPHLLRPVFLSAAVSAVPVFYVSHLVGVVLVWLLFSLGFVLSGGFRMRDIDILMGRS